MKPASEGLAAALAQLEASFRKRGPREERTDGKAADAKPVDFDRHRRQRDAQKAAELVRLAMEIGLDRFEPDTVDALERVAHIFAEPRSDWTFVMLSPAQNSEVVDWLAENSKRPLAAVKLWGRLFKHMRMDTGEIMLPPRPARRGHQRRAEAPLEHHDRAGGHQRHPPRARRAARALLHEPPTSPPTSPAPPAPRPRRARGPSPSSRAARAMADEPENHALRLLGEMRQEMREGFEGMGARIDGLTHSVTMLASYSHGLEERLTRIVERQNPAS